MTVVEYMVSTATMDTVRQHRFESTDTPGEYLTIRAEWAWNYSEGRYNERRDVHTIDVTPDGTVAHDGRPLEVYAKARAETLTDKRFGYHADRGGVEIVRTR